MTTPDDPHGEVDPDDNPAVDVDDIDDPDAEEDEVRIEPCPACGQDVTDLDRFCEACGASLPLASTTTADTGATITSRPSDALTCPYCDAPGSDATPDGYCGLCGRRWSPVREHDEWVDGPVAGVTDRGTHHWRNEDAVGVCAVAGGFAMVVCDGVSASQEPQVVAQAAVDTALPILREALTADLNSDPKPQTDAETEPGDRIADEAGDRIVAETGDRIVAEVGDRIVAETGDRTATDSEPGAGTGAGANSESEPSDRADAEAGDGSAAVTDTGDRIATGAEPGTETGVGANSETEIVDRIAAEAGDGIAAQIGDGIGDGIGAETVAARLEAAIVEATAAAQKAAAAVESDPGMKFGPGACTYVAVVSRDGQAVFGSVGDSRAYWVDADGAVQIGSDDSLAAEMVAAGRITEEQAMAGPGAHTITKWLGADSVDSTPEITAMELTGPGLVVLVSDGLWNYTPTPGDFAALVGDAANSSEESPLELARRMVAFAEDAGGADNITVAVAPHPLPEIEGSADGEEES